MLRWIQIGMLLAVGLLPLNLYSQGWENLPAVQPGRIIALDDQPTPQRPCIQGIIKDAGGRLWLKTCGTTASFYRISLLQYDGYELSHVDLDEYSFDGQMGGSFAQSSGRENIMVALNGKDRSVIFCLNGRDNQVDTISSSINPIRNLIVDDDRFFIGTFNDSTFSVYVQEGDEATQLFSLKPTGDWAGEALRYQLRSYELWYTDGYLWVTTVEARIYRYELATGILQAMEIDSWVFENPDRVNPKSKVIVIDGTVYAGNRWYTPGLFKLRDDESGFAEVAQVPAGWKLQDMFQDELGQVLFLWLDTEGQQWFILQDRDGKRWDYSAIIERLEQFKDCYSSDFRRELFIGTALGAYYANVRQPAAIRDFETGNMRWILEMGDSSVLMTTQQGRYWLVQGDSLQALAEVADDDLQSLFRARHPRTLVRSPDGRNWILYRDQLLEFDPLKPEVEQHDLGGIAGQLIFLDRNRLLYMDRDSRQLHVYDLDRRQREPLLIKGQPLEILNPVQQITYSPSGLLRLATIGGLYRIDLKRDDWELLGAQNEFPDFRILYTYERPDGLLWIGTVTNGLFLYDPDQRQVITVTNKARGLSNNTVVSILPDSEGDLWVATYDGLNLLSADGEVIANVNVEDGISYHEFNRFSSLKGRDGRLWFGSLRGMNVIDPIPFKQQLQAGEQTRIYLRELRYYDNESGREQFLRNPDERSLKPIRLTATRRNLGVKVAMSNYGFVERNRFAYRLEGINEDWIYLGQNHELQLSNLPPGRYRLLIRGINHRGVNTETLSIPLHVKDFFYRQSWFYILLIGVLSAVAFFWIRRLRQETTRLETEVRRRTQQIQTDKELIEQQAGELLVADELKSRFFTNISHELRTPLTLILTSLEQFLRRFGESLQPKAQRSVQKVRNNAQQLSGLVEELLELSRIEAGKSRQSFSPTPLRSFVYRLFIAFESAAEEKGIGYEFETSLSDDLQLMIDRNSLEKIVNNLLSNALKFTPADGRITLALSGEQAAPTMPYQLRIAVKDSGRGIPSEDLPFVFDRFYQSKHQQAGGQGGSGIGLALAKELATLMRGQLRAESEWGKGSQFVLTFPAILAERPAVSSGKEQAGEVFVSPAPLTPLKATIARRTILVVEDNLEMQALLEELLSDQYDVLLTANGKQALQLLRPEAAAPPSVDLILSDVMMPEMDGYTLLLRLKEDAHWQHVPVILLTARAASEDRLAALRMGVDDYLTKPFAVDELLARVANLLQNYTRRQDFQEQLEEPAAEVSANQFFLEQVEAIVGSAIDQKLKINTAYLAGEMAISDRQLLRRLKSLTGLSIQQYMQEVKLQRSRRALENRTFQTIAEVAYANGFNTPSYFTKVYHKRFGKRPAEYFD